MVEFLAMRNIVPFLLLLASPLFVFADGSQMYSTPGTFSFSVPIYSTLTVQVWGGGGGGAIATVAAGAGGLSSFAGSVIANGGGGGNRFLTTSALGGAGGTASGGTTNTTGVTGSTAPTAWGSGGNGGAGANGGAGGTGTTIAGTAGTVPGGGGGGGTGGGGGGGGGYSSKTYSAGALSGNVSVVVGSGGTAGTGGGSAIGGLGAAGRVTINWTLAAPTCSVWVDNNPIDAGSGTQLHWSSSNADWFYINSVGYVSGSGSVFITPAQTTNYDGSVGSASGSATCQLTLTVNPCPNIPESTADGGGYVLHTGQTRMKIDRQGVDFCVDNTSGSDYFIPTSSAVELQSFKDAVPTIAGIRTY